MAFGQAKMLPDLRFSGLAYGTHQVPWDLTTLAYRGGAAIRRDHAHVMISNGKCGRLLPSRLPLLKCIHGVVEAKITRSESRESISTLLTMVWQFYRWADETSSPLTIDTIVECYVAWTESLLTRVRIAKDIEHETVYKAARRVADLLARALGYENKNPGISLLHLTRLRRLPSNRKALAGRASEQLLANTFEYGHLLTDLCFALSSNAIAGAMPLIVTLRNGTSFELAGGTRGLSDSTIAVQSPTKRDRARTSRAPLPAGVKAIDVRNRSRLVNLRIEAELQIFVAQTGMNLASAARLRRDRFRWQTDSDGLEDIKVYKARRGGEAIFRCFKGYREHLAQYLKWLDATSLSSVDDRLFPFVYTDRIPTPGALPCFKATSTLCRRLGIQRIPPRHLRRVRVNWLYRRSRDATLTAEQSAHTKATLLRVYVEPHFQSAAAEIVRFHAATEPALTPPGPGICASQIRDPRLIPSDWVNTPSPDCVSPDGCLFCAHHRDVMSYDYCWKLASHARLKALELCLYKPPKRAPAHPAKRVIDRICEKLAAIAQGSEVRARWVRDAEDAVRAGRSHPVWAGHIQLAELLT